MYLHSLLASLTALSFVNLQVAGKPEAIGKGRMSLRSPLKSWLPLADARCFCSETRFADITLHFMRSCARPFLSVGIPLVGWFAQKFALKGEMRDLKGAHLHAECILFRNMFFGFSVCCVFLQPGSKLALPCQLLRESVTTIFVSRGGGRHKASGINTVV